jgi:AcrR family transcriptional regulator
MVRDRPQAPTPGRRRSPPVPAASRLPRSPRLRAKREHRKDEILHAALLAFREHGFAGTTLDDIAARLDVRKTALYHYFPDKEAILYACHRESLAELDRIVREARHLHGAPEQLRHVIQEHVRVMVDTLEGSPLAMEVRAFRAEHRREMIAGRDRYERAVRRMIDRGVRSGAFRKVDPKLATFAILGAINWIARWYRPDGALRAPELGAQFAAFLVGGLQGAGGTA